VQVLWQTDAVTEITVPRRSRFDACATPPDALEIIRKLFTERKSDQAIAAELNRCGLRTGFNRRWGEKAIRWVRSRVLHLRRLPVPPQARQPDRRDDGLYSLRGVANRLRVTDDIVRYWIEKGWLEGAEGGGPGRVWWFNLDGATVKRLKAAKARGYGPRSRQHSQTRVRQGVHHA